MLVGSVGALGQGPGIWVSCQGLAREKTRILGEAQQRQMSHRLNS